MHKRAHARVSRHHHVAHLAAGAPHVLAVLVAGACLQEEPVPGIYVAVGGAVHLVAHARVEAAGVDARGEGAHLSRGKIETMREEHGGGVTAPDLEGVDEEAALVRRDVDEELRGVVDLGDCGKRVVALDDGEVRHRVEREEIRAGEAEEVSHGEVGGPRNLQVGQAVEHVERLGPLARDHVVNLHGEGLEAFSGVEVNLGHAGRATGDDASVRSKAQVDNVSAVGHRAAHERVRDGPELAERAHLPHHVVAQADGVERLVQAVDAAGYTIERCHACLLVWVEAILAGRRAATAQLLAGGRLRLAGGCGPVGVSRGRAFCNPHTLIGWSAAWR